MLKSSALHFWFALCFAKIIFYVQVKLTSPLELFTIIYRQCSFSLFTFATTVTIIYHGDRYNDTGFTFSLIKVLLCDLAWKISFWSKQKTVKNSQENFHKIVVITNSQIQLGIWKMRPPDGKSCSAVNYKPSFFGLQHCSYIFNTAAISSTLLYIFNTIIYLQHCYCISSNPDTK